MTDRKLAFRAATFDVCEDSGALPNGVTTTWDVVCRPAIAVVVAVPKPGEVILIRQYRAIVRETIWELPAGKVGMETPRACAVRELEEETGQLAKTIKPLGEFLLEPGFTDEIVHVFGACDLRRTEQRCEPDEFIEVVQVPLADALAMISSNEMRDAKSALALLVAATTFALLSS